MKNRKNKKRNRQARLHRKFTLKHRRKRQGRKKVVHPKYK